jgi:carboxypeptidase Q
VIGAEPNERIDTSAFAKIRDEGLQRSQVMDTLWHLTDVYGPRLTNSPQMLAAAKWTVARLQEWRIDAVHTETWGPFGRGWSNDKVTVNVVAPAAWAVIAFPKAWTPGTVGAITADAILIEDVDDLEKWTGKLRGRIVVAKRPPPVTPLFEARARRLTDEELAQLEQQPPLSGSAYTSPPGELARRQMRFFAREGVVAVMEPGQGVGDRGSVLVMGDSDGRRPEASPSVPQLVLASEHYGRIVRLLRRNMPVRIELNVQNRFYDAREAINIVAEIPGTDKTNEVVMIGAHFDSWHAGTGATDNAVGVAAMMEAMRILKASGLSMRRTVRLALWTGEEQGLLGSQAYVAEHFANRETLALKPEHDKLSVYFNLDHGTGVIRGVYTEGNAAVRPIFKAWMEPLSDLGISMTTARGTGDTDHVSFDEVGLPAFQFVQDPIEYFTLSHHSNMDVYDRVLPEDVKRNAVIVASFAYQAANRDDLLPRKPRPSAR